MSIKKQIIDVWNHARDGYNEVGWAFVVLTGGTVLERFIGVSGIAGAGIATAIFYGIGRLSKNVKEEEIKKKQTSD